MNNRGEVTVRFLVFDGIGPLEIFGPVEALTKANSSMKLKGIQYE